MQTFPGLNDPVDAIPCVVKLSLIVIGPLDSKLVIVKRIATDLAIHMQKDRPYACNMIRVCLGTRAKV